jgi:hypothetical protein
MNMAFSHSEKGAENAGYLPKAAVAFAMSL